ncbi:MAG: 16S rRNA (guanine(966)-N(2))-methyltransferase RsmD [Anaerolineae bacterium]|nr:16S rRNA (guanine(966)-N(2))-methyltransferase RsmD [Anaerolineae bacterium]
MRVIAGSAKGIQLQPVPGSGTRPISDRVKESVFNILGAWIVDAHVLDLFAGTGSVGIEALSRGAAGVTFVERYARAASVIRDNLRRTRLEAGARIVQADVFSYLAGEPEPFDLVYIAPPQYQGLWRATLLALEANPGWLRPDGLAIVQIFPKELEPVPLTHLVLTDERKYGSTLLCFYEPSLPGRERD